MVQTTLAEPGGKSWPKHISIARGKTQHSRNVPHDITGGLARQAAQVAGRPARLPAQSLKKRQKSLVATARGF